MGEATVFVVKIEVHEHFHRELRNANPASELSPIEQSESFENDILEKIRSHQGTEKNDTLKQTLRQMLEQT